MILEVSDPLIRIMARAPSPEGVAHAAIVSVSELMVDISMMRLFNRSG